MQSDLANGFILSCVWQILWLLFEAVCVTRAQAGKGRAMAVIFNDVRRLVSSLKNVEEGTSYGTPAFKLGGKLIARLKEDGESLVVGTTFEEREEMMAAEPETYYITDHYLEYPWVLVRLSRVRLDALRDLLNRAFRLASVKPRRAPVRQRVNRSRRESEQE